MIRRLLALTVKDLRVVARNHFLTAVLVLAVVYALAVNYLVPGDPSGRPVAVVWDTTALGLMGRLYLAAEPDRSLVVDSEAAYREALEEGNRIGIKVLGELVPERIEVTYQGYESARMRRVIEATLHVQALGLSGANVPVFETRTLRGPGAGEPPPFNLTLVPVLILTEAAMVGLLLAAALLFSEKEEQTLAAYRVTPGGLLEYMTAKGLVMGLMALAFTVLFTVLTVGATAAWLPLLTVVFLAAVVVTVIALALAVFYRNLSQFMLTAVVLNFTLALPVVSYFQPSFSPAVLRLLPSYPLLFALREAYFPAAGPAVVTSALGQLGLTLLVALPAAVVVFRRQFARGDA